MIFIFKKRTATSTIFILDFVLGVMAVVLKSGWNTIFDGSNFIKQQTVPKIILGRIGWIVGVTPRRSMSNEYSWIAPDCKLDSFLMSRREICAFVFAVILSVAFDIIIHDLPFIMLFLWQMCNPALSKLLLAWSWCRGSPPLAYSSPPFITMTEGTFFWSNHHCHNHQHLPKLMMMEAQLHSAPSLDFLDN